jgi:hypothetical protein
MGKPVLAMAANNSSMMFLLSYFVSNKYAAEKEIFGSFIMLYFDKFF